MNNFDKLVRSATGWAHVMGCYRRENYKELNQQEFQDEIQEYQEATKIAPELPEEMTIEWFSVNIIGTKDEEVGDLLVMAIHMAEHEEEGRATKLCRLHTGIAYPLHFPVQVNIQNLLEDRKPPLALENLLMLLVDRGELDKIIRIARWKIIYNYVNKRWENRKCS